MIIHLAYKVLRPLQNISFRLLGIKTIGARALVIQHDQVLLIKHTYQKGWRTIGGGVKRNESPIKAIVRELSEEVGVTPLNAPDLFAIYYSQIEKRDDYVAFYIVKKFDIQESYSPEIAEKKWFSLHDLPADCTPATKRRVEEFLGKREKSDSW